MHTADVALILTHVNERDVQKDVWDDAVDLQHVSIEVHLPLIGRIYGYAGHFTYRVVAEQESPGWVTGEESA